MTTSITVRVTGNYLSKVTHKGHDPVFVDGRGKKDGATFQFIVPDADAEAGMDLNVTHEVSPARPGDSDYVEPAGDSAEMLLKEYQPGDFKALADDPNDDTELPDLTDDQPLLGLATNRQLRDELAARERLGHTDENYRSVGSD